MGLFPGSLPVAGTASTTDTLAAAGHTSLHNTSYDEIRALATKIGTGSSVPTSGLLLRGNGVGTSAWAQVALSSDVSGVLPVASGGSGVTTSTGSGSLVLNVAPTISNPSISGGGSWSGSPTISTPTLSTPVIASFASATHSHQNAAGGGTIISIPDSSLLYGKMYRRQGGSATDFSVVGTTTYDTSASNIVIQDGSIAANASPTTVTFPVAFSQPPIVQVTVTTAVGANCFAHLNSVSSSSFVVQVVDDSGAGNTAQNITWSAKGPA
jgi:hypothetical protein